MNHHTSSLNAETDLAIIIYHLHPWWRSSSVTHNRIILTLSIVRDLLVILWVKEVRVSWLVRPSTASDWLSQNIWSIQSKCISCHTGLVLVYVKCITAHCYPFTQLVDVNKDSHFQLSNSFFFTWSDFRLLYWRFFVPYADFLSMWLKKFKKSLAISNIVRWNKKQTWFWDIYSQFKPKNQHISLHWLI